MHPCQKVKWSRLRSEQKMKGKPFLEQLLKEGARKLLQAAIENEVIDYIPIPQGSTG